MARIVVAEDDAANALVASRALTRAGHQVAAARTGLEALQLLQTGEFDVLVTDWMMPDLDGLELLRKVRARFDPVPATVMLTCLTTAQAEAHALDSGADEFVHKPFDPSELASAVARALGRQSQETPLPGSLRAATIESPRAPALFPLVVVGANAGGPAALRILLRGLPRAAGQAAFVVAQHGQATLVEAMATMLQRETLMPVRLAEDGQALLPGCVLVGPGGRHVAVARGGLSVEVRSEPDVNNVRPAADPLFASAASAHGSACIAVVLTGMGRDAVAGAERVRAEGGRVMVAAPGPHVASAMPDAVIRRGLASEVAPLEMLGGLLGAEVARTAESLRVPARAMR